MASITNLPAPGPIVSLANPANGAAITVAQLNAQGYVDVTYTSLPAATNEAPLPLDQDLIRNRTTAPFILTGTALLRERVDQARERGYAVLLDVVVERMGGIGVAILDTEGRPVAALSIAALNDRILAREPALAQALLREATVCQVRWAEATRADRRPIPPHKETRQ